MSKETRAAKSKRPCQIVEFTDANAREIKQAPEFVHVRKVFLEYINDDYTPKMLDGKKVVGLKSASTLTLIGFVD